jgi:hypothetical protein
LNAATPKVKSAIKVSLRELGVGEKHHQNVESLGKREFSLVPSGVANCGGVFAGLILLSLQAVERAAVREMLHA